ncbi:MAG: type III-B CRISPR-associated protein Cas10/Cmr2 [Acidithiobacillus sp.]
MTDVVLWQTKLAARLHDPVEKALVLLRDPAGHENGTSRALMRLMGLDRNSLDQYADGDGVLARVLFPRGVSAEVYKMVQRADWWAAAADRPQWPMETVTTAKGAVLAVAPWAQVRWAQKPELIHPLTGDTVDLQTLAETDINDIKDRAFDHFSSLLLSLGDFDETPAAWRKRLLTFWRFGPELQEDEDNGKLGALWGLLPADTRVPDHSIWDHLDLTSAFAGAMAADAASEPALLTLSLGPVQSFIAAARSTSDLWAGSHLLSRLAWEMMRPIAEQLGPDAILFPRLRGIPQVDLWLRDIMGLPDSLFTQAEWQKSGTDANPLFSAALPNRLVAIVPADQAQALAEACTKAVRAWLQETGAEVVSCLLKEGGYDVESTQTPYEQMHEQLAGFPEVHWAAVPFSLIRPKNVERQRDLDTSALLGNMAPFFGVTPGQACGFLESPAWKVLQNEIDWNDGKVFFAPNPGVLYPAVYDLAERALAAAKSVRAFAQQEQMGWRDTLTGESEWLTTDRAQLALPPGQRKDTLWTRVAQKKPSWAKKGEHLGALGAIKRLWPTIFCNEVGKALKGGERGEQVPMGRFVVSTHTMALAHQLDGWLKRGGITAPGLSHELDGAENVALPRRLIQSHRKHAALADAKRLPALLEAAQDAEDEGRTQKIQDLVRQTLSQGQEQPVRLEGYYGMLMLDGDRMGAILSGDARTKTTISYREGFHSSIRKELDKRTQNAPHVQDYLQQQRAISPNRHLAISGSLNDFSQTVVRHVVEAEHLGRVIYAGGDDVLAMLPVADLCHCMGRLRATYSGVLPEDQSMDWGALQKGKKGQLHCKNGFAFLNGRLLRMMGAQATASCGAVVAHHQAPLSAVLQALRAAEQRAKGEGGRDAFSITIIKRSGGDLTLTAHWGAPLVLLTDLMAFLRHEDTSRRAVYRTLAWLRDLPDPKDQPELLEGLLAYQLKRQSDGHPQDKAESLARRLVEQTVQVTHQNRLSWLENFLTIAEFLARETRHPHSEDPENSAGAPA